MCLCMCGFWPKGESFAHPPAHTGSLLDLGLLLGCATERWYTSKGAAPWKTFSASKICRNLFFRAWPYYSRNLSAAKKKWKSGKVENCLYNKRPLVLRSSVACYLQQLKVARINKRPLYSSEGPAKGRQEKDHKPDFTFLKGKSKNKSMACIFRAVHLICTLFFGRFGPNSAPWIRSCMHLRTSLLLAGNRVHTK